MKRSEKRLREKLLRRAEKLIAAGFSVIPVHGDSAPAEPKKPTIKWRAYQKRIANAAELWSKFDDRARALGVVCGQVSRLLVIDFDDHLRFSQFCRHLPQFARTYVVKTRRGYHLYFLTREKVPSHQFDGGDIKGEGSYVVAPPSVIAGYQYEAVRDCEAIELDKPGLDRILNYFHVNASVHVMPGKVVREARDVDLLSVYRRLVGDMGRNNALYRSASLGRESGMRRDEVGKLLISTHVEEPAAGVHKFESYGERLREARATIGSAFSSFGGGTQAESVLPNSVRERLLTEQRSSVVARFLDILRLAGWQADGYFRLCEAIELGSKYSLDRKSVMAVLTGDVCSFNGRHIISRRYVEYLDIEGLNFRKRGRPVQLVFQVPSVARLLSLLNVTWSPSDRISPEDVKSGHAYRRAVHREYIRRLSPQLPMRVLAERLGVSTRTIRRYNRDLAVRSTACIGRFRLTLESLSCLPQKRRGVKKNATEGYWLEVGESARFPAWRHIGAALLKRGDSPVRVCIRRPSVLRLDGVPRELVRYEKLTAEEFMRVLVFRGEASEGRSVLERAKVFVKQLGRRASRIRYDKVRLSFDSVEGVIADDKVAGTISGYLYAYDEVGDQVRRPARRGVAYRMLKEFGNGNVFLALRDSYSELLLAMARHGMRAGESERSVTLLARAVV